MDPQLKDVVLACKKATSGGCILMVEFTSVDQYLHLLKAACVALSPIGKNAFST